MNGGPLGFRAQKKEKPPRNRFVDGAVRFFATGCYIGYTPVIPGTAGAAIGVLLFYTTLLKMKLNPLYYFFVYLVCFLIGSFICTLAVEAFTEADHNLIVVDKMLGAAIAVSHFPPDVWQLCWQRVLVAFLVYRLWEIAKIFPLGPLSKLAKGWGVMADDVAGGIIALVITMYLPDRFWEMFGWTLPLKK
jgi:phosphatidylglycerophosphatase A